ncbi:hypothetical protein ACLOJK_002206 [Asimina triloba]
MSISAKSFVALHTERKPSFPVSSLSAVSYWHAWKHPSATFSFVLGGSGRSADIVNLLMVHKSWKSNCREKARVIMPGNYPPAALFPFLLCGNSRGADRVNLFMVQIMEVKLLGEG